MVIYLPKPQLLDLPAISDEVIREHLQERLHAQALLLTLKHIENDNLQAYLETILIGVLHTLDASGYGDDVANLLYYIYNEGNLNDSNQFFEFLHLKFSKEVGEKIMTLGQKARHEAEQKGMQQGKLKQAEETALFLLNDNMEIPKVAKATQLSIEVVRYLAEKIKKAH